MDSNRNQEGERLSIGLSIFIAICVIGLFCAISIAIAKNIDKMAKEKQTKFFVLPAVDSKQAMGFIL